MKETGSLLRFIRRIVTDGNDLEDGQLLARFACHRDEAAFAELVRRHGPMVLGVCRRVHRSAEDAEDAFQAAFLVLARKAGSIGRPEALGNWLYGVAFRSAMELHRKDASRRERQRVLVEEPSVDAVDAIDSSELRSELDHEIHRLPDKYRSAFVLCTLEGRTSEEAAWLLGCPKGTIHSRLSWARERLRSRLARRGFAMSVAGAGSLFTVDSLGATVSTELVRSTAHLATLFVCGQAIGGAKAIALMHGVLKAMFIQKCKLVSAILVVAVIFGGGFAWFGQLAWPAAAIELPRAAAPANEERVADVLIDLEKRGWEAVKTKDAATLRRLLAEEYVAITSDGTRLTWSELLLAFPFFELKSHELSGFRVIPLGIDAAIVTYEAKSETDIFGVSVKERTQISSTWVRRKSEWRNVFYQETTVDD